MLAHPEQCNTGVQNDCYVLLLDRCVLVCMYMYATACVCVHVGVYTCHVCGACGDTSKKVCVIMMS